MSDESPAERKEAAATRRRWVTLAEVVAVAGVVIAALTLWTNWSERRSADADRTAAESTAIREKSRLDLGAEVRDGGRELLLKDTRYDIQDVAIAFPRAFGVGVQRPPADPVIEAAWFEQVLLQLTDGGPDERSGRLPILVTLRYWDGDATRSASGIYDLIWKTKGRFLHGRSLRLEGMRIHEQGGSRARLDAIWTREKP